MIQGPFLLKRNKNHSQQVFLNKMYYWFSYKAIKWSDVINHRKHIHSCIPFRQSYTRAHIFVYGWNFSATWWLPDLLWKATSDQIYLSETTRHIIDIQYPFTFEVVIGTRTHVSCVIGLWQEVNDLRHSAKYDLGPNI